jgi:hypothetical protein
MQIVAAGIDGPTRGDTCDVRRGKKAGSRSGALSTSVKKRRRERTIFDRDERGWVLPAGLPTNRHCKTESAGERAYIRHRSPAPLGTQVL